jgi:hypothetical protein
MKPAPACSAERWRAGRGVILTLVGAKSGKVRKTPVMRIVDGDRDVAWHPTAGCPPARPGMPIWLCTRGCGFRMAPASRSFKPARSPGGGVVLLGGRGPVLAVLSRISTAFRLPRHTDHGVGASCAVPTPCCLLDVAIVPFRQEQALTG